MPREFPHCRSDARRRCTMRYLLATLSCLFASFCVHAADPAQPNTLTPKEIADGWVLLFDGKTTFGWMQNEGGGWHVVDGTLQASASRKGPNILRTSTVFGDF